MFDAWAEVEDETGLNLVTQPGGLDLAVQGTLGEDELNNYRNTLAGGVRSESLDADELRRRWPQWHVSEDAVALYQQNGGFVDIRRGIAAHRALAAARGVEFLPNTKVTAIDPTDTQVTVHTSGGDFTADSVVLCTASWAGDLLKPLGVDWSFTISQEQVSYFSTPHVREFMPDRFPTGSTPIRSRRR